MLDAHEIRHRGLEADAELSEYQFGAGVTVNTSNNWDRDDECDFTKVVYIRHNDVPLDAPECVSFHVRFHPNSTVSEVVGLLVKNGEQIGFRPGEIIYQEDMPEMPGKASDFIGFADIEDDETPPGPITSRNETQAGQVASRQRMRM